MFRNKIVGALTALGLSGVFIGCKPKVPAADLTYFSSGQVSIVQPNPISGAVPAIWQTHFYETGELKTQIEFRSGMPTGQVRVWWPNGTLQAVQSREDAEGRCVMRLYSERGDFEGYKNIINGKTEGPAEYYRPDQTCMLEVTYRDDHLNGPVCAFWSNGVVAAKGQYGDGKKVGMWNYWNQAGCSVSYVEFRWMWGSEMLAPPIEQ